MLFSVALGKMIHEKKTEAKKFARLSLSEEDTDGDVVIKHLTRKQFREGVALG
jgi:hypothetical protein